MANTAFDHASALTLPGSTTNNGLVRWGDTSAGSFGNITGITSDGSNLTLLTRGEIRFSDADSSHYIALESPATVSTSYTMALPAAVPSANDYLKVTSYSGGAGVLEWATAGGGIASVLADTTPQLGGNLDMQARLLVGNGGSTGIAISANGEVTMAAQPGFQAYNSANDLNVTGNGTVATVDFNTEIFDQNSDFASDTFTAPITGRYLLMACVWLDGFTASGTDLVLRIVTSNQTYSFVQLDPVDIELGTGGLTLQTQVIADMDAADTALIHLICTGEGADTTDIIGGRAGTNFQGWLLG